jgi:hypothetical protein
MGILLLMLPAAIIPSGNYNWDSADRAFLDLTPQPSGYAICYFKQTNDTDPVTFASMVISVLLLSLGFAFRVIRLHKSLSIDVIG